MAKGQKRSNREAKKPKAVKPAVVAETLPLFNKGSKAPLSRTGGGKKH